MLRPYNRIPFLFFSVPLCLCASVVHIPYFEREPHSLGTVPQFLLG